MDSRERQGLTIFFTGLSGAGKSTIANVLLSEFIQRRFRRATLLDGDLVRQQSPDMGFSKEDRDRNIRRIGLMASEITKAGGIAVCAAIAPYDETRKEVRTTIEQSGGGFLLVHISTPLAVCEQRDPKRLYAKARAGTIAHFTGISDPYEAPSDAELTIDTSNVTPAHAAQRITDYLERERYIPASSVNEVHLRVAGL